MIDGNTYNYGYIGSRATGPEAGDYMVVGPDWKGEKPAGIKKVFTSTTPFALTVYRTQLFNPADMPNVEKVQAGYKVQPLSSFLKQPAPPASPKIDFMPASSEAVKENFFGYLAYALQFIPPSPEDKEVRAKLAKLGVEPGKPFEFKNLSPEQKAAAIEGMKAGEGKVKLWSPTRAALLTGRNHHSVATGVVVDQTTGYPGYNSVIPRDAVAIGEIAANPATNCRALLYARTCSNRSNDRVTLCGVLIARLVGLYSTSTSS